MQTMKIYRDSIEHLASLGHITLQIPDDPIGTDIIDCPKNWFCWIKNVVF